MTSVYFVRHAQPDHSWEDDRTRPLTEEGHRDSGRVTEVLKTLPIDRFYASPYQRSVDTIRQSAEVFQMEIRTDERFREREKGIDGNNSDMFQKRWADFDFCEEGGESLGTVQKRNIKALLDVLNEHRDKHIVIATHGTALSTILNYYHPDFGCADFLRMIDFMPYVIRLDFDDVDYIGQQELLMIEKEFIGAK